MRRKDEDKSQRKSQRTYTREHKSQNDVDIRTCRSIVTRRGSVPRKSHHVDVETVGLVSRDDADSLNLLKSTLQDGVVLDAWVQSHAIDTVAPQQVVKVQPIRLVLLFALLKLLLVVVVYPKV